jgi:hypothetical protein
MSAQLTTDWLSKHSQRLNHEFKLNGYVSIPGFFNAEEMAEIHENKERFIRDIVPTMPNTEVYYEDAKDPSTLKQLIQLWKRDSFFATLTIHWADGNSSKDKSRQAMGAIFYAERCKQNLAAKKAYQAALDAQLAAKGMI